MSISGSFEDSARQAVTQTGDALALDASGNIVIKPGRAGPPTSPYGVFTAEGNWPVDKTYWYAPNVTRVTPQTTAEAVGLRLASGLIVPVDKGNMWGISASLYFSASGRCRVWAIMEGLGEDTVSGARNHSGHIDLETEYLAQYPAVLTISTRGQPKALDDAGTGFGAVQLGTDNNRTAVLHYMRIVVSYLGRRPAATG